MSRSEHFVADVPAKQAKKIPCLGVHRQWNGAATTRDRFGKMYRRWGFFPGPNADTWSPVGLQGETVRDEIRLRKRWQTAVDGQSACQTVVRSFVRAGQNTDRNGTAEKENLGPKNEKRAGMPRERQNLPKTRGVRKPWLSDEVFTSPAP